MSSDLTVIHRLVWFNDHESLDAYLTDILSKSKAKNSEEEATKHNSFEDDKSTINSSTTSPINRKFRGLAPIHLAVQLGHKECVKVLIKHGADMLCTTDLGFLALQEATSLGDREMMRELLLKRHEQIRDYVYKRQPHLYEVVKEEIESFYLEMNWDFKSWVPFFSMLCPSDCYKIWKKGNRIRIDTSLIGFDKLRWLRGNVTYLFIIEPDSSSFYLLDHDRKIWQHVRNLRDFTPEEVEKDLNLRLNQEIVSGRVDSRKPIAFSRSRTLMGLGDEMVEDIGRYRAKVYAIENLEWVTRTRKEHLRDRPEGDLSEQTSSWFLGYGGRTAYSKLKNKQKDFVEEDEIDSVETLYRESVKEIRNALSEDGDSDVISGINDHLPDFDPHKIDSLLDDATKLAEFYTESLPDPTNRAQIPFEEYFPAVDADPDQLAALPYIHMGRKLAAKEQRKKLAASIWMSHDFPLTINQLLPLFEILSPSNEHFHKLREFISLKLPPGFPVQVELPVLMFLSARITFRNYETWTRETRRLIPIPSAADPTKSSKKWFEIPEDYTEGVVIKSIIKTSEES